MLMSVFRQGQPTLQIDHLVAIREAVDPDHAGMVLHAWTQNATVLIGLRSGEAIIKPAADGDEQLSFEALYDTCISLSQWKQMKAQRVVKPEDLAPHLYELDVLLEQARPVRVRLRIKAKTTTEVSQLLNRLVREDKEFQDSLMAKLTEALLIQDDGSIISTSVHKVEHVAPGDAPLWSFVPEEPG
jgi:hypothetical protein